MEIVINIFILQIAVYFLSAILSHPDSPLLKNVDYWVFSKIMDRVAWFQSLGILLTLIVAVFLFFNN